MKAAIQQRAKATAACVVLFTGSLMTCLAFAQDVQRIRIRMGDQVVTGTLNQSEAARDFGSMLPLTIDMDDHLRREKTGVIPGRLSERTQGSRTYEVGDLGHWRPRNTFVIFYRHDGLTIPGPGIVRIGKLDSGMEVFDIPGTVKVTVELIQ